MKKTTSSLQLNRTADYAIRALIRLAQIPPGERLMLPELARETGTPESFLSKILQKLCRAGLASSSRGSSGGFQILPKGRNATIASVVAAVEGPIRLNACLVDEAPCHRKDACPASPVWASAQLALLKVLDAQTIAQLAAPVAALRPVRTGRDS